MGDFFAESSYTDNTGRTLPCYGIAKKGCEFIAHKLTGQKGTEFTARYINRFHEMEGSVQQNITFDILLGELASYLKVIDRAAVRQNTPPHKIMEALKMVSEQFGIHLPEDLVNIPKYHQLTLADCN